MNNQTLPQNEEIRKAEAQQLLEQANRLLGEAVKSYQQAFNIYQDIGEETFATLISNFLSQINIPITHGTDKLIAHRKNLASASSLLDRRPIVKGPKKKK
jgi:hypothetical protein